MSRTLKFGLAAAFAVTALAAPAFSQSGEEPPVAAIPLPTPAMDIVVTTARRSTDVGDEAATVSKITRDQLEAEALTSLADALQTAPGVQAVQSGPAGSLTSVFIRGSNAKHALALYDGIRINDASSATGVFNFGSDTLGDAQRIEIVRGPLSSVYGSDAIGGVINIIPRTPPDEALSGYGEIEIGELETRRLSAGLGTDQGRWRLQAGVEGLDTTGFNVTPGRMSTAGGEDDGARLRTFTSRAEVDLAPLWTLDALYRWREAEVEFDTFSGGPSGFQRADDADLESEDQLQVWAIGLSKDRGDFRPRLRVGEVTTALDSFDGGGLTDTYESERDFASASFDYSFRVGHGIKDPEITVGLDWQDDRINTDTAFNAPLSASEDVVSAFAIGRSGFDLVELSASIRVDDYQAFGEQTTANVGLVWELWNLNTVLRASYGASFKAPTLSERFASSAFITPNPDLEPEEGESFELGFETEVDFRWRRDGLRFGAVWYDSEIENLIENVFDFTTFTGTSRNIGRADLTGWEVFLALSPNDVFDMRFDYTNTDAVDADTGEALLRRPEHAFSASADWQVTAKAGVSARYSYTGERLDVIYDDAGFFVSANGEIDAFETVDLTGRYDVTDSVELFAAVRNLFDEEYEQPAAFAGAPRTVSVGVRWRP